MRSFMPALGLAVLVFTGTATAMAQTPSPRGNPQTGREYALHDCDACHIVAANQQMAPLLNVGPSFFDIAKKPGETAASLQDFLTHSHPRSNMPYPSVNQAQAADLAAYILSLRSNH